PGADGCRLPEARDLSGRGASGIDGLVWYSQDSIRPQRRGALIRNPGFCSWRGSAARWLTGWRRLRAAEQHEMWAQSLQLDIRLSRRLAAQRPKLWSYRPQQRPEVR